MNVQYKTVLPDAQPDSSAGDTKPARPVRRSIFRGMAGKCPACGQGKLFDGFLATRHACEACGEAFHHHRADDAPPYFTITIVGHIIIPALLAVEVLWRPALWIHMTIWIPLTILLAFAFMRPVKGALVALQWALYMHGFDPDAGEDLPEPDPAASIK
ncbi:hypothetical protein GCM10011316_33550 [Roseibium aquae]|uniref:DUF983 domain-containing protein n=1 Tax=Roseibium aquae TaxID=1323746 RepID=A0A916X3I2_9HYPH|nr:DUF983 domain-containing protein [Roseibium aquae]GGB58757.1 hypothetical protein GCM10011316_33550 [Roseibium aquae]